MNPFYLLVPGAVLMPLLLTFERSERQAARAITKLALSSLFIATAILVAHPIPSYYHWILAGLVLGLVGDVALALEGDKAFRIGLVAFLIGHLAYLIAFARLTQWNYWITPGNLIVIAIAYLVFRWLKPHAGRMIGPVTAYIAVISLMVMAALAASRNPGLNQTGLALLLYGAIAFFVSDILVARNKFIAPAFFNRAVSLPLYYAGQFLIAYSVGYLL